MTRQCHMRFERSGHYPTLGLVGSVSRFEDNKWRFNNPITGEILESTLRNDEYSVTMRLDVPIYEGGRVSSRTKQARYLLDATGQDLDDVQRAVVREAQNSYRAVLAGIQEVQAFEQAMRAAELPEDGCAAVTTAITGG